MSGCVCLTFESCLGILQDFHRVGFDWKYVFEMGTGCKYFRKIKWWLLWGAPTVGCCVSLNQIQVNRSHLAGTSHWHVWFFKVVQNMSLMCGFRWFCLEFRVEFSVIENIINIVDIICWDSAFGIVFSRFKLEIFKEPKMSLPSFQLPRFKDS